MPKCAAVLIALLLLVTAGCGESGSSRTKRIILLTNGSSPFWDACAAGAFEAERELNLRDAGYHIVIDRADFRVQEQVDKLRQYASATDVAAVGISVTDANSLAIVDEMKRLRQNGIQVITIDSDVDRSRFREHRSAYLGTDNVTAGRELGRAARQLMPDGAKYATFVGLKEAANARERIGGFAEGAGENFEQLENLGDGGDPHVCRTLVRDALDRNPQLELLVGIWSYNAPAIVDVLRQQNQTGKVRVLCFDAEPTAIRQMQAGEIDVLLVQNPWQMGYDGVRLMKALIDNDDAAIRTIMPDRDSPDGDIINTGLKVVVPDASSPLQPDQFEPTTEFLTLQAFRAWLIQYKLTGS